MGGAFGTWFENRDVVAQLPLRFQGLAAYFRAVVDEKTGIVRGGSALYRALRAVDRKLALNTDVRVEWDGQSLYLNLADPRFLWVFQEAFGAHALSIGLQRLLRPGDTFWDLGANHGAFSLVAARVLGTKGSLLAVEPQPHLASLLRQSLARSARVPWDLRCIALSDEVGEAMLEVPAHNSGAASLFHTRNGGSSEVPVHLQRLDDALPWREAPGRMVWKIDVEGAETKLLRGAQRALRERQPIVIVEVEDAHLHRAGSSARELLELLRGSGYERFMLVDGKLEEIDISALDVTRGHNVVAIPSGIDV